MIKLDRCDSVNCMEAVIFDMDGLLIDTELKAKAAWQRAAKELGIELSDQDYLTLVGRTVTDSIQILEEKFNCDLKEKRFLYRVDELYYSSLIKEGIVVKEGAKELLQQLSNSGIPKAVATSTEKEIAIRKLRLAGLSSFFEVIVSGEDVQRSKPFPDVFFAAARSLGVLPERCIVLEDSFAGVMAADAAGMMPIMIPDLILPTKEITEIVYETFFSLSNARETIFELLSDADCQKILQEKA